MQLPDYALKAFTEAEQLFSQGDYQGAIARIDASLPDFEGDVLMADALNNKGFYLLHLAKWEEAIAAFEKAYLTDPSFDVILCHLAWAALMIDNREGAQALMDLFYCKNNEYQALHQRNLALLHSLEGNSNQAILALDKAREEDPYLEYFDVLYQANGIQTEEINYPEQDRQAVYLRNKLSARS
ncbi:MAG: tetratricopeptide repeat protein [Bacteroidota bacterium]|nr:tetratricopeptide repeat protein [Bacteroidota bacterium]MDX5430386.1 tetratricopeptide repeat protein [Bacteroidota bacterium]MDX5469147.1 tetratricopeptide repeat protein [Bacteroidota bacterium]